MHLKKKPSSKKFVPFIIAIAVGTLVAVAGLSLANAAVESMADDPAPMAVTEAGR